MRAGCDTQVSILARKTTVRMGRKKNTRCPVLCLAPTLGRRQIVLFLAAASCLVWLAIFELGAKSRVYAADRHGGMCCYVLWRALVGGGQAVVKAKGIVACGIQSGVERFLVPRQVTLLRRLRGLPARPPPILTMLCVVSVSSPPWANECCMPRNWL
jgi:hypothetical protein